MEGETQGSRVGFGGAVLASPQSLCAWGLFILGIVNYQLTSRTDLPYHLSPLPKEMSI